MIRSSPAEFLHHQEALPKPQLHFTGRFIRKGQGHDLVECDPITRPQQQVGQTVNEEGRLACSSTSGHDDIHIRSRGGAFTG